MLNFPNNHLIVHFTGIGGIGMSGIAELLHNLGCRVQGSDLTDNANVERLRKKEIPIMIGHDAKHVKDIGVLVISSAVPADNPEIQAARVAHIPVIQRAEMLAELMRLKKSIAIGGTHGKTTTTSLVAALFETANYDPTVVNGGVINSYGSNTRTGRSEWLIAEADESDGSFVKLPASIAVITNIDPEHMEHYGDFENLKATFLRFVQNIPFYGFAVLCADHPEVLRLMSQLTDRRVLTYGFNTQSMVRAFNLQSGREGTYFDVEVNFSQYDGVVLEKLFLPMYGEHNVQNALAAVTIGLEFNFELQTIRDGLSNFEGVKRRFSHTGTVAGIKIIDDYAHHPVEIRAVLKACRGICHGQLIVVAQPHRYSRLQSLFNEFQTAFHDADIVLISDVYPAGEVPIEGVDRDSLVQAISDSGHKHVIGVTGGEDLATVLSRLVQENHSVKTDMIIFLGAGSSTIWAHTVPAQLQKLL